MSVSLVIALMSVRRTRAWAYWLNGCVAVEVDALFRVEGHVFAGVDADEKPLERTQST